MAGIVGIIVLGFASWSWYERLEVYQWPQVAARVESAKVEVKPAPRIRGREPSPDEYRARIKYRYEWAGRSYVSTRVEFDGENVSPNHTRAQMQVSVALEAKEGKRSLLASVNPLKPEEAILLRGEGYGGLLFLTILALSMVLWGGFAAWIVYRPASDGDTPWAEARAGKVVSAALLCVISVPILIKAPAEIALGRGPAIYIALLLPLSALLAIVALTRK